MIRRILWWIREIIEVYLAVFSFSIMFVAFLIQIFWRYVLDNPLTWPFEVTTVAFVWAVLFGAIYAMRRRDHLKFNLFYERMPEKIQPAIRIFSNLLVCVGFAIAFYPAVGYIEFMNRQSTTSLDIPFSIVYFPFLVFLIAVICYTLVDIIADVRLMVARGGGTPTEEVGKGAS